MCAIHAHAPERSSGLEGSLGHASVACAAQACALTLPGHLPFTACTAGWPHSRSSGTLASAPYSMRTPTRCASSRSFLWSVPASPTGWPSCCFTYGRAHAVERHPSLTRIGVPCFEHNREGALISLRFPNSLDREVRTRVGSMHTGVSTLECASKREPRRQLSK